MRILFVILCFPVLASAAPLYVRGAIGFEQSRDTTLRDVDCSSSTPPALFGCGFAARGDFGHAYVPELAIGAEMSARSRVELALADRRFDLEARPNFLNTPDPQSVAAKTHATTLFVNGAIDLTTSRVRPFVTAGAGLAHNAIDRLDFAFPGISPSAVTDAQGGTRTNFAWTAGLGVAYAINDSLSLDVVARWNDLGEIRTDAGTAHIVRPTRTFDLEIAGSRAELRCAGVSVGVRWRR